MSVSDAPAASAGAGEADLPGSGPRGVPGWLRGIGRNGFAVLGLVPFFAYTVVFLGLPTASVAINAFRTAHGTWTLHNISLSFEGIYRDAFITSLKVALTTSAIGVVFGGLLAQAVLTTRRNALLRRVVTTASGVFANFGGVPLAFAFIATLGSTGMVTRMLHSLGFDLSSTGFSLFTFSGIVVVYTYFQVPLMVLVITPALEGLRPQWREAAEGLGATGAAYWRHIGLPVLAPALLGSFLLLFGSAFAAYATAWALTSGTVPLVPIKIGTLLSGNVITGGENLGKALGFEMIVVIAVAMVGYVLLTRRVSRWLR
ncbi:ABC transporter permease subunit [Frankia sp. AgB32]|uniref:ABC transporter permease n=1 Tax=Frankia sp. AgB32 TaxID=631119 RepID=UPI00200C6016|nr:ABC transporter permease subunit [Frankia sp. AgB32]MCK9893649.1 ABC transporter permease subunit [Frankia sp. AgB32]